MLIPARQEEFLKPTVEDVLAHAKGDTEVIVVLDGAWADPPLAQHPRVQIVHLPTSIGQRAATNLAARISTAKYIAKLDAHCSVDDGFDVKLIEAGETLGHEVTQIPRQYNLHIYNWKCLGCGGETYHGPTPTTCRHCAAKGTPGGPFERVMYWDRNAGGVNGKHVRSDYWCVDESLHFQYMSEFGKRPEAKGHIVDVMSSLGACFFMRRERFYELGGLDEAAGSWGQFGQEVAFKSWLSGGRHVVNKATWFAHFFRVGGIGFPYEIKGSDQEKAREYARYLWLNNRWPQQIKPVSWLVEKFAPVQGWSAEAVARVMAAGQSFVNADGEKGTDGHVVQAEHQRASEAEPLRESECVRAEAHVGPATNGPTDVESAQHASKGIIYYSDCRPDPVILDACREQLTRAAGDLPIVSCTLRPVDLGLNIVLPLERGYLTMARQILIALEISAADVIFFAEHDLIYHASHFQFTPEREDTFYYNQAVWKVDAESGHALFYHCNQLSGLCAYRALLLEHFRVRVARIEREGFTRSMGFEPGTRKIRHGGVDDRPFATWVSDVANIDIRHTLTLTPSRWKKSDFRSQRYTAGWTESDGVPGWPGKTKGRFQDFLRGLDAR